MSLQELQDYADMLKVVFPGAAEDDNVIQIDDHKMTQVGS